MLENLPDTVSFLRSCLPHPLRVGMILGSGLGDLAEAVDGAVRISYREIPHFPRTTVSGHAGNLVAGEIEGVPVLLMQGRLHYYEGYSLAEVTYPVRVMLELGVEILCVTNAAGGLNPAFQPGEIMLITDHLNFLGDNPLRGPHLDTWGPRFVDMSEAYDPGLRHLALRVASRENIMLRTGVYAAVPGPSYETPAEVRFLRTAGADAVGMSTVPEVIVARHGGMRVLGFSVLTNMAAGVTQHTDVLTTAARLQEVLVRLLRAIFRDI